MDLRETPAQQQLRKELRAYFAALLPDAVAATVGEAGAGGSRFREVVRMLGRDGWLGVGWPVEYGGQGRSIEEQFIFFDEVQRAGLPFPLVTLNTVGPTLMQYGTEEQKQAYLPGILAGDIVFAIGYTEPGGRHRPGLAHAPGPSATATTSWSTARRSSPPAATPPTTCGWPCRTDPEAPSTRASRSLIVPCDDPGFSWSPIQAVGGHDRHRDLLHRHPGPGRRRRRRRSTAAGG